MLNRFSYRVTVCSESGQASRDGFKLAAFRELVHRVDACRLEQPIAWNWTTGVQRNKRFRHETCQATRRVGRGHPVARGDRARRGDRKGAAQDGEPPHDRALSLGQQSITPVERRSQRLLPCRRGAAAVRKQTETLIESRRECFHAERGCVRCRELDRQWDSVQATAYFCRRRRNPRIKLYAWLSCACAQDKQLHSAVLPHLLDIVGAIWRRLEGWHPVDPFSVRSQWLSNSSRSRAAKRWRAATLRRRLPQRRSHARNCRA